MGIDIHNKTRFLESCENGGETFLMQLFSPQELRQNSREQLASIFSLKEACIKALELPSSSWHKISTNRLANGKVTCSLTDISVASSIISLDTSISHEGELIVSVVVVLLK